MSVHLRKDPGFFLLLLLPLWTILCAPGCPPPEPSGSTNLDLCVRDPDCPDKLAVGHRGAGSLGIWAPENTLMAFQYAWWMGADSVEIDVRDTADGIPVLMHDDTVDRTTNGKGQVSDMTLEQIKALKIRPLSLRFPPQQVPTLREGLAYLRAKTLVDLDLKSTDIARVVQIIEEEDMLNAAYLLIGSIAEGEIARAENPDVALMPKVHNAEEVQAFLDAFGASVVMFEIEYDDATPDVIAAMHDQGVKVHMDALGVREFVDPLWYRRLIDAGADIIQTDRLRKLVPFLDRLSE